VITADEGIRGGRTIPLKATVDEAVEGVGDVRRVFVMKRTGAKVNMQNGRDVWLEEVSESMLGSLLP
jgi:acetyl-CoA synthetase